MLFRSRLVLANCDLTIHRGVGVSAADQANYFQRQFNSALISGEGVAIGVGILVDILGAHVALRESAPLIDRCQELFASEHRDEPLILVRGIANRGRIDLVEYFDERKEQFTLSAYGERKWANLSAAEQDDLMLRLQQLSDVLNAYGARAEAMPEKAPGRLGRHVNANIKILATQNRCAVEHPTSLGRPLAISFDEISEIATSSPSRSEMYRKLGESIAREVDVLKKVGVSTAESAYAAALVSVAIKREFIDPGYNVLFAKRDELIIDGNLGFFDQKLLELFREVGSVIKYAREDLPRLLERDYPRIHAALPKLPWLLRRVAFFLSATFAPQLLIHHLARLPVEQLRTAGGKLIAAYGRPGVEAFYRNCAAAEPFDPAVDDPMPTEVLTPEKYPSPSTELAGSQDDALSDLVQILDTSDDIVTIAKIFAKAFGSADTE